MKRCENYCGVTCVNGNCPKALHNYSMENDVSWDYDLPKNFSCNNCGYYKGCDDCCFYNTDLCKDFKIKGE